MPQYRVHVYPVFMAGVDVEAETPEQAAEKAEKIVIDDTLIKCGHRFTVNDLEFSYAEGTDDTNVYDAKTSHVTNVGPHAEAQAQASEHARALAEFIDNPLTDGALFKLQAIHAFLTRIADYGA